MTDPYNSSSVYAAPRAKLLADAVSPLPSSPDTIETLAASEKWKKRFHAIHKAGGPALPRLQALTYSERRLVNSNWTAFFFWPIYLPLKGLWRQALAYLAIAIALGFALEIAGLGEFGRVIGYGLGAVASFRANIGYYRRVVLDEISWL